MSKPVDFSKPVYFEGEKVLNLRIETASYDYVSAPLTFADKLTNDPPVTLESLLQDLIESANSRYLYPSDRSFLVEQYAPKIRDLLKSGSCEAATPSA